MNYKIINDPVPYIFKAVNELYPDIKADIQYHPELEGAGCTTFPDDGTTPLIDISIKIPISAVPEILAHEFAHIVNPKDGHGEKWEKTFDLIFNKAYELYESEEAQKGDTNENG